MWAVVKRYKNIIAVAVLLLIFIQPIFLASASLREIQIVNSDFEEQMTSWLSWYSAADENFVNSASLDVSQNGLHSLKIQSMSTVWQSIYTNQIATGAKLSCYVYVYLKPGIIYETMPAVALRSSDENGSSVDIANIVLSSEAASGQWHRLSAENIIVPDSSRSVAIVLENHTNSYLYFDNVKLYADETIITDNGTPISWRPGMEIPTSEVVTVPETIVVETQISRLEPESEKTFSDTVGHWAEKEISYLASCGVILGVSDEKFEPEREITNNEFNLLIGRLTNKGRESVSEPDEIITREEATVILVDILPPKLIILDDTLAANFYDSDNIKNLTTVSTAVYNNVINGKPGNLFDPKGSLIRAEVAVILCRFLNLF